jgi:CubicO group peptidase (beta-lactamase class C family)
MGNRLGAIGGHCDRRLQQLREAFIEVASLHPDHGAALAITLENRLVTHLWAGMAGRNTPWEEATRCIVWSATKGMAALCVQVLSDQGLIDVTAPVAHYWPEFAAAGKESVTVTNVLTHTAGLPYWSGYEMVVCQDHPSTLRNLTYITGALAAAEPVFPPGLKIIYHAVTYGWLLDEIVFRATGIRLGRQFARLLAGPLDLNIRIGPETPVVGTPATLTVINNVAVEGAAILLAARQAPDGGRSLLLCREESRLAVDRIANDPAFVNCGMASVGGIADARSLARAYGMLANGGRLEGVQWLSQDSVELFSMPHARSYDPQRARDLEYGLGYRRNVELQEFGSPINAYGHAGLGGSIGFADPDAQVGFAFVVNSLDISSNGPARALQLVKALYDCI